MSQDRFFDHDPLTGAIETFHYDDVDDSFTINRAEDIEAHVELNKAIANDAASGWRGDTHRVASLPSVLVQDLRQRGILQNPERLRDWLNDPDNRVFRTKLGRV